MSQGDSLTFKDVIIMIAMIIFVFVSSMTVMGWVVEFADHINIERIPPMAK